MTSPADVPSALSIRTLVVDDEKYAREGLRDMLAADLDLQVRDCSTTGQAFDLITDGHVELAFLDVQMPGMTGLDLIERVGADRMPIVVFTTAYSEYAIRAFEASAIDYLLKPISDERLTRALRRAKDAIRQRRLGQVTDQVLTLLQRARPHSAGMQDAQSRIPKLRVRSGNATYFLDPKEIDWIEAADNYSRLWTGSRSHLIREPIRDLEAALGGVGFVRIHRTAIVNVARIRELRSTGPGRQAVVLLDGKRLPVSRDRRGLVQQSMRTRSG